MPRQSGIVKEEQGNKPAFNSIKPSNSTPTWVNNPSSAAWANRNNSNNNEEEAISQIRQSLQPDIFNANVPQSTVNQARALTNAAAQNNMFAQINRGETFNRPPVSTPAWLPNSRLNPLGQVRNNNNGNNNNNNVDPSTYTGTAGYSAPYNAAQNPATMIPTYQGEPVNNSMSDTLRSMTPVTRGNGPTLSDYLRSIQSGAWTPATAPMSNRQNMGGFGSNYGGNWRGGGGGWDGGGGNWGGNGYDSDRAAWINYMQNLYSWNIK